MLNEDALVRALRRHWDYSGKDEDISHEIYHDDAVWSSLTPVSASKASRTFVSGDANTLQRSSVTSGGSTTAPIWWSPST